MSFNQFVVNVEFCNGYELNHPHHHIKPAAREWADRLGNAVDPASIDPAAKHIRQVTLEITDTRTERSHLIDSGVFGCEHQGVEA